VSGHPPASQQIGQPEAGHPQGKEHGRGLSVTFIQIGLFEEPTFRFLFFFLSFLPFFFFEGFAGVESIPMKALLEQKDKKWLKKEPTYTIT
jgi:hypothetical protein